MKRGTKAKPPEKQKTTPAVKPRLKWQKDDYSRTQEVRLDQPYQFLLLCKLVGTPPVRILDDFMINLSGDSFKRATDEHRRNKAVEYFIQCGYGQEFYTEQEIRQLLKELDTIGSLWPDGAKMKLIDRHAKWRNQYQHYWFNKWYRKLRRKPA